MSQTRRRPRTLPVIGAGGSGVFCLAAIATAQSVQGAAGAVQQRSRDDDPCRRHGPWPMPWTFGRIRDDGRHSLLGSADVLHAVTAQLHHRLGSFGLRGPRSVAGRHEACGSRNSVSAAFRDGPGPSPRSGGSPSACRRFDGLTINGVSIWATGQPNQFVRFWRARDHQRADPVLERHDRQRAARHPRRFADVILASAAARRRLRRLDESAAILPAAAASVF